MANQVIRREAQLTGQRTFYQDTIELDTIDTDFNFVAATPAAGHGPVTQVDDERVSIVGLSAVFPSTTTLTIKDEIGTIHTLPFPAGSGLFGVQPWASFFTAPNRGGIIRASAVCTVVVTWYLGDRGLV